MGGRVKAAGAELVQAGTLAQARRVLGSEAPDAALIDIDLPDGKGTELMSELRGVGVFLMSGSPLPTNLDRTRYVEFFPKPFRGRPEITQIEAWRQDVGSLPAPGVPDARSEARLQHPTV